MFSFLNASTQELTVNILPQKYFVEKIVKDKFTINVMVKPGASPHNFEPKPSQMRSLVASKVYFLIGDATEKIWIEKFEFFNNQFFKFLNLINRNFVLEQTLHKMSYNGLQLGEVAEIEV